MSASFNLALFDETQTEAKPSVAQSRVESDRCFESILGILQVVFSAQEKSAQCMRGGVARRKL
jgi:hypothetical protein